MERKPFDSEDYLVIDTLEKAQSIFQSKAGKVNVDIKLPIYFKGNPDLLTVVGQGRIGINRDAKFDLEGSLTMNVPFQMASRATVRVLPGAKAVLDEGAFVYTAAYVELGDGSRIGKDAIVAAGAYLQRSLNEGDIFVGDDRIVSVPGERNREAGRIAGKITDKKYETVPDEWKDRESLPPKVEAFKTYKKSKASMSGKEIIQFALSSAEELFKHRSLPFAPESLYLAAEFSHREKQS